MKRIILVIALAITAVPAVAQDLMRMRLGVPCLPTTELVEGLANDYNEEIVLGSPRSTVEHINGEYYTGVLMLTATPDWSKHSVSIVFEDGYSCVLSAGGPLVTPSEFSNTTK